MKNTHTLQPGEYKKKNRHTPLFESPDSGGGYAKTKLKKKTLIFLIRTEIPTLRFFFRPFYEVWRLAFRSAGSLASTNDISTNDISTNNIPTHDITTNYIPTNDILFSDTPTNNITTNVIPSNDISTNDIPTHDISTNDIPNRRD